MTDWTSTDRAEFLRVLRELWPNAAGSLVGELARAYVGAGTSGPFKHAVGAARALKTRGAKWLPEIPEFLEAIAREGDEGRESATERRRALVESIRSLVASRNETPFVELHGGTLYELSQWGLVSRSPGPRRTLVWSEIGIADLEAIAREGAVLWESPMDSATLRAAIARYLGEIGRPIDLQHDNARTA